MMNISTETPEIHERDAGKTTHPAARQTQISPPPELLLKVIRGLNSQRCWTPSVMNGSNMRFTVSGSGIFYRG